MRPTKAYLRTDCILGTLTLRPTTTYLRIVFTTSLSRDMAIFSLQLTFKPPPSHMSSSQVCQGIWQCFSLQLAFTSHPSHMTSPQVGQEIWQCFSLQLTFTSPPSRVSSSQVCQEIWQCFTYNLLHITFITSLS